MHRTSILLSVFIINISICGSAQASWCGRAFIRAGRALGIVAPDVFTAQNKMIQNVEWLEVAQSVHADRSPVEWGSESVPMPPANPRFSLLKQAKPVVAALSRDVQRLENVQNEEDLVIAVGTYANLTQRIRNLFAPDAAMSANDSMTDSQRLLDQLEDIHQQLLAYYEAKDVSLAIKIINADLSDHGYENFLVLIALYQNCRAQRIAMQTKDALALARQFRILATKAKAYATVLKLRKSEDSFDVERRDLSNFITNLREWFRYGRVTLSGTTDDIASTFAEHRLALAILNQARTILYNL